MRSTATARDGEGNEKRSSHLAGGSLGALGFSVGLQFSKDLQETKSFQFKLTQLARALTVQGRGVLILVDELQANSDEVRQLVSVYQELIGERLDVALVMAGLPGAVSATLNDRVLTFLNRARRVTLQPLSFGDVDSFFEGAFRDLGLRVASDVRVRAAKGTCGSPYLLQLVGHNVVVRAAGGGEVDEVVLDDALAAARIDFENDVCRTTLFALSEKDIAFLRAMSVDKDASKVSQVANRMGVTADYAQKYRRRLLDAGIIEQATRGEVVFAIPLLADYLRKNGED